MILLKIIIIIISFQFSSDFRMQEYESTALWVVGACLFISFMGYLHKTG